ncbi:hypothetical protein STAFG_5278 [Streptomyces afghaniensis 772]|uniref:Uncharacterized protein n=1 Tax=Streptomyces afghaniensis 772 TaxID=1283301 RepID=S4MDS7_9ACTN|nr:hypothetical protein STAFG_5278 [Streptomyces afghaniensis 772]
MGEKSFSFFSKVIEEGVCLEVLDPLDALCEGPGHLAAEACYPESRQDLRTVIGAVDL